MQCRESTIDFQSGAFFTAFTNKRLQLKTTGSKHEAGIPEIYLGCLQANLQTYLDFKMPKNGITVYFSSLRYMNEKKQTPPPCRWSALVTLPILANFQLVFCADCCLVLFRSSCLFEHTLTAACALPEYQSCRKYNAYSSIL